MKVCIIMSTYNGKDYIEAQLNTIVSQKGKNELCLYIRDDGSSDNTVEIIERFISNHRDVNISLNKGKNLGAAKSFMCAIRKCGDADIYAFSDQDDVWIDGKLDVAIPALENRTTPALWISDYLVVDKDLNVISNMGIKELCSDQLKALFFGHIPGCVMVFNKSLMNEIRKIRIDNVRMHDIVTLNVALITGELIYEVKPYIKYRQHGNNAIGYDHKKIKPIKWIEDKVRLLIEKEPYDIAEYAAEVLNIWSDVMSDETKKEYELISQYKESIIKRLVLLSKPYTKYEFGRTRLSIRCKILLGLI